MDEKELEAAVEGILFAVGEPISIERIASVLDVDTKTVQMAISNLSDLYDYNRRGIRLVRMNQKVQFCTRAEHGDVIRKVMETRRPPALSQAALEVLSIVAYRQPVTRAFVEQLRGVDSSNTMSLLQDKGFIEDCGRLDVPGQPILFRTTHAFLRVFGIESLKDLPDLPELTNQANEQLCIKA